MIKKIFLTILILCGLTNYCFATTYEIQTNYRTYIGDIYGANWSAQTFIPTTTHSSFGIKIWLGALATRRNEFKVFLCNFIAGLPENACFRDPGSGLKYLAIGTIYSTSVNPISGGAEYHILFNNLSTSLATNTTYAIVLNFINATSGSSLAIYGNNANGYASGSYFSSINSGNTWTPLINNDLYFKILGEAPCPATSSEDMCTCTTTLSYISNTTTGAGFWLDSSISLGDFLIVFLLSSILLLFILHFIFGLEIPKRINFKRA